MENNNAMVFVPEEDITVCFAVTEDKPFNACFECSSFRNGCSGPNLLAARSISRVSELYQYARILAGYSYQYVAEETGLSLATVKRVLTGKITDPSWFVLKALNDCLVSDPNGKYPCAIPNVVSDTENSAKLNDALRELERVLNDNKEIQKLLDNIQTSHIAELHTVRAEAQEKIDYLRKQVDKLQEQNDLLWAENTRKAKIVDTYLEKLGKI